MCASISTVILHFEFCNHVKVTILMISLFVLFVFAWRLLSGTLHWFMSNMRKRSVILICASQSNLALRGFSRIDTAKLGGLSLGLFLNRQLDFCLCNKYTLLDGLAYNTRGYFPNRNFLCSKPVKPGHYSVLPSHILRVLLTKYGKMTQ